MKILLPQKIKYFTNFADYCFKKVMGLKYGIQSKYYDFTDNDVDWMRFQILKYQENLDNDALTDVAIRYRTWLAVNNDAITAKYSRPTGRGTSANLNVGYPHGYNSQQNIIEINAGGCLTRINLNPSIVINNSTKYEHFQSTPAFTWVIQHNLGFTPNVFTTDDTGVEIEGVVDPIDDNSLQIIFSQPVAGYAYLS